MLLTRIAASILTALVSISVALPANAGDWNHHGKHGHPHRDRSFYIGGGVPSYIRGLGTYLGSIAGYRDRYNGLYFAVDGFSRSKRTNIERGAAPRIIHVSGRIDDRACSYEAGVCVIRP